MRYEVRASGPDGSSTYPECWGVGHRSRGQLVAECSTLEAAIQAAIGDDRGDDIYVHHRGDWEHVGSVTCGRLDRQLRARRRPCPATD